MQNLTRNAGRSAFVVLICVACAPSKRAVPVAVCSDTTLNLAVATTTVVPDSLQVSGGILDENGSFVLFGRGRDITVVDSLGARRVASLPSDAEVAVLQGEASGVLRVLDRLSWKEYETSTGQVHLSREFKRPSHGRMIAAAPFKAGWVVAGVRPRETGYEFFRLERDGSIASIAEAAAPPGNEDTPNLVLGATPSTILVSTGSAPFVVWGIDGTTGAYTSFDGIPSLRRSLADSSGYGWRALSFLPVGCLYVLAFADLKSDRRAFALYSPTGKLLRITYINAQMGLFASSGDRLVGFRRGLHSELVTYKMVRPDLSIH